VTTVAEARAAVQDNARMKPAFIKIWVDDRNGQTKKLTPEIYQAIIEEAHRLNLPVAAHNVTLADARILMRAGVEGWLHLPVRNGRCRMTNAFHRRADREGCANMVSSKRRFVTVHARGLERSAAARDRPSRTIRNSGARNWRLQRLRPWRVSKGTGSLEPQTL
jgi:hypothetical protein